ncbi:hypothetical protein JST97_20090 [bacterium]|nr:hypothetical protein [bacterium]
MRLTRGMSLLEVVFAVFLLAFVGLSVMLMADTAIQAQKRNQNLLRASLVAQSKLSEIRAWAEDPANYLSDWSAYSGSSPDPNYPDFRVNVRALAAGRSIDSPCQELESQWEGTPEGKRSMPRAVVPVELTVSWGNTSRDQLVLVTYVGEPLRDLTGSVAVVSDPNPADVPANGTTEYQVSVRDSSGRLFENLLFSWSANRLYLSTTGLRDGRRCLLVRDRVLAPTDPPPPLPPEVLPVQCLATYAGTPLSLLPKGLTLP